VGEGAVGQVRGACAAGTRPGGHGGLCLDGGAAGVAATKDAAAQKNCASAAVKIATMVRMAAVMVLATAAAAAGPGQVVGVGGSGSGRQGTAVEGVSVGGRRAWVMRAVEALAHARVKPMGGRAGIAASGGCNAAEAEGR